ncbi:ComEC/Rec2 family competence protein [Chloroflexota bacterium]
MKRLILVVVVILVLILSITSCTPAPAPASTTEPVPIPTPMSAPTGELIVHFIDVGQGDAILIDLDNTEILIDGGGKSPGVVTYLKDKDYINDEVLEVMVATHPHADHIGGLIAVLGEFEVAQIWHNGDKSDSKTYDDFMSAVQSENAEVHIAQLHDTIQTGNLSLYVHNPSRRFDSINNNSIVLHLAYGNIDFLFTGDAEKEVEGANMVISSVRIPEVEILKVGHHGSRTSSSKDFLTITSPEIAIYMAKKGNSYGHPHEETMEALNKTGAKVYGTDIHGTIVVTTDGKKYEIQLEK